MDKEQIRALRQRLGWTQQRLADEMGVSWNTVCRWEMGDRHPSGPALKLLQLLDAMHSPSPDRRKKGKAA